MTEDVVDYVQKLLSSVRFRRVAGAYMWSYIPLTDGRSAESLTPAEVKWTMWAVLIEGAKVYDTAVIDDEEQYVLMTLEGLYNGEGGAGGSDDSDT